MAAQQLLSEIMENHPYPTYMVPESRFMIIGTFPIGKFTNPDRRNEIAVNEIDFFYGGSRNLLWTVLSEVFSVGLQSRQTIESFLTTQRISVGDVISSCRRKNGRALDRDLYDQKWNFLLKEEIKKIPSVTLLFTSRYAEKWFFKHIDPEYCGLYKILISPSPSANRGIAGSSAFKEWKLKTGGNVKAYRLYRYRNDFGLSE